MWIHELSHRDSALRRAVFGVVGFARWALIEPVARWQRRRATMNALSALDDRMLSDIGIRRSEIELVLRGKLPRRIEHSATAPAIRPASRQPEPLPEMKRAA